VASTAEAVVAFVLREECSAEPPAEAPPGQTGVATRP
jgi:hypothetical protein